MEKAASIDIMKKIENTKHFQLEIQPYLCPKMLFLRANYRHLYNDVICPLCFKLPGQNSCVTQEHLLLCKMLQCNAM